MILKSVIRDIHVRRKWRDSSIQSLFKFSLVSYLSNDIPADFSRRRQTLAWRTSNFASKFRGTRQNHTGTAYSTAGRT